MARSTHPGLPSTKKVDDATSRLENAFDRSKTVFLEEAQSIIRSTLQSPIGISRRIMASKQLESLLVTSMLYFSGSADDLRSVRSIDSK